MNRPVDELQKNRVSWIIAFRLCYGYMIVGTIMTFLYIFTPMKKPFTLIFGVSAFNVWISVGLALAATAISTIAANKARAYSGLIDNATAVGPESDAGKP